MSFTQTPNYALYKPTVNADNDVWGNHINANTDTLDALIKTIQTAAGVTTWNTRSGAVTLTLTDVTGVGGAPNASPAFSGTPSAPTAAPGTSTGQLATTQFVGAAVTAANVPGPSVTNPVMNGAVAIGALTTYAKADHVHPVDTSRYAASNPSGYQTAAQVSAAVPSVTYADNCGFAINQRGYVSGTSLAAGIYSHDRWKAGAGGCTYTFVQSSGPATTITITAGTLQQVVEGAAIVGGNYMLSWTGTAHGRVGAGSYATSPVSVSGITAGANTTIEFNTGTLGQVKFEAGTVATPWVAAPPRYDLSNCQRFYQTGQVVFPSSGATALNVGVPVFFGTSFRSAPTVVTATNSNVNLGAPSWITTSSSTAVVQAMVTAAGGFTFNIVYTASADL